MAALFINASTAAWSFACKLGVTISQCHCHNVACKAANFFYLPQYMHWFPSDSWLMSNDQICEVFTSSNRSSWVFTLLHPHHSSPWQPDIITNITTTAWHHNHHYHDSLTSSASSPWQPDTSPSWATLLSSPHPRQPLFANCRSSLAFSFSPGQSYLNENWSFCSHFEWHASIWKLLTILVLLFYCL